MKISLLQFKANPLKSSGGKGTHLVHLYHLLFDLIYNNDNDNDNDNDNANGKLNPAVVYCGRGARIYDWISKILPESWIQWLLK